MSVYEPDSPDGLIQCFIDPVDWDGAEWGATVFTYEYPKARSDDPPGIGIAFANFEAGKKIFDSWIERVGRVDEDEELRVSLIEGPLPSDRGGYTVCLSSNPLNTIKRRQRTDPSFDRTKFVRTCRLKRMVPAPDSPHLTLFKIHFARVHRYRLFPAHFAQSEIQDIDLSRSIEKKELNLLHTSKLKRHELEYAAIEYADRLGD